MNPYTPMSPEFIMQGYCNDCQWVGEPSLLESDGWEQFIYCPSCGSDDTEIRELIYNETIFEYEVDE